MPKRAASTLTWGESWVQLCELAWAAPQVVAYRTIRMATGGWPPNARDRLEYSRMITEKFIALGQVATAVLTASPATGTAALHAAIADVIEPLHRTVLANHRRLAGR